jgi:(1->4)-alpha-D-glucan 1-alpha-D-glucosylmutase
MEKALREAKVHTSWTSPNAEYEEAVRTFVARVLDEDSGGAFLREFAPFQARVSHFGLLNSLSQTLLRLAAPGAPDTYQGTELWDFSLVDPDNRRPVDSAQRRRMLAELRGAVEAAGQAGRRELARELVENKEDGRVKLFVTWQALAYRRERPGLLSEGEYLPCGVGGERMNHAFGFVRRHGGARAVAVAPRLMTWLAAGPRTLPLGRDAWGDTWLALPEHTPRGRLRHLFTGEEFEPVERNGHPAIALSEAFAHFPVALLVAPW